MKKIIIFAKALGCGGTEVALLALLNNLDYSKYEVDLLLLDSDEYYKKSLPQQVNVQRVKFDNKIYYKLVSWEHPSFFVRRIRNFFDWFCKVKKIDLYSFILQHTQNIEKKYDLAIDFHGYGYYLTAYMTHKISAKKKVMWIHDERMLFMKKIEKFLPYIDNFFCVSKACKEAFGKIYPQYIEKTEVFYNLIDTKEVIKKAQVPIEDNRYTGKFKILTVGRVVWQKGYDIAIKVAYELKQREIEFKWFVIGEGTELENLKEQIRTMGLEEIFIFLGKKSNPYPYMKNCDLYIQPSRHEGYGITILEARVLKKTIVASDLGPIREQIIDGVNGYLTSLEIKEMADLIQKLVTNKKLREKVVDNLATEIIDYSKEICKLENLL